MNTVKGYVEPDDTGKKKGVGKKLKEAFGPTDPHFLPKAAFDILSSSPDQNLLGITPQDLEEAKQEREYKASKTASGLESSKQELDYLKARTNVLKGTASESEMDYVKEYERSMLASKGGAKPLSTGASKTRVSKDNLQSLLQRFPGKKNEDGSITLTDYY